MRSTDNRCNELQVIEIKPLGGVKTWLLGIRPL